MLELVERLEVEVLLLVLELLVLELEVEELELEVEVSFTELEIGKEVVVGAGGEVVVGKLILLLFVVTSSDSEETLFASFGSSFRSSVDCSPEIAADITKSLQKFKQITLNKTQVDTDI